MERLDKILANTGRWSRKEARELVRAGRVSVDGVTARSPEEKYDPAARFTVDGDPISGERLVYLMLHKPSGLVSATEDPKQPTVLELLPEPDTAIVTLREGKYHQIKRMLACRGKPVCYLKRLTMGPLSLDPDLERGMWRPLTGEEVAALRAVAGL